MSAVFKFKDGDDDGSEYTLIAVNIEPVNNGYVVNYSYEEEEFTEVFVDKKQMLDILKTIL